MKRNSTLVIVFVFLAVSKMSAQQANRLIHYEQNEDHTSLLKSTLVTHNIEENIFWPLYDQYDKEIKIVKSQTFESLQKLTLNTNASAASDKVRALLSSEKKEAELRREFFEKTSASTNGAFALQFLQSEALLDLLLKSRLYEKLAWEKPLWNPVLLKDENAKIAVFEFTLGISKVEHERFKLLVQDFEFEYSRVVGHEFVFFEQCLDDVRELTPRQCKSLGESFTTMQQKEVRVKERFFEQLSEAYGPNLAARFIALEEYFTIMAKLKVWSDYLALYDK